MTIEEFFFLSLGLGIWILIALVIFVVFQILVTLSAIRKSLNAAARIGREVALLKEGAKMNLMDVVIRLVSGFVKK